MADVVVSKLLCCPKCDYSLEGLPENYQCPECGTDYDENCRMYRESKLYTRVNRDQAQTLLIIFFAFLFVLLLASDFFAKFTPNPIFWIMVFLIILIVFIFFHFISKDNDKNKTGYSFATTSEGVWQFSYGLNRKCTPWNKIEFIQLVQNKKDNKFHMIAIGLIEDKIIKTIDIAPVNSEERKFFIDDAYQRIPPGNISDPITPISHCIKCFKPITLTSDITVCKNCNATFDKKSCLFRFYPRDAVFSTVLNLFDMAPIFALQLSNITSNFSIHSILYFIIWFFVLGFASQKLKNVYYKVKVKKRDFTIGICADGIAYWNEAGEPKFEKLRSIKKIVFDDEYIKMKTPVNSELIPIHSIPIKEERARIFLDYINKHFDIPVE